jgi:hypothetical protein
MGDSQPLINVDLSGIGELSKPANTLIERVTDAVGGAFRPQQMRRVARAEVDVELIKARGALELSDLQQRALERLVGEEAQKQANIESITGKAIPQLNDQASPEEMERDWISHFFDSSKLISDEAAQMVWSRLLAGEANEPGKFSKRTINVLATLDGSDAELFTKLCSFAVDLESLFSSTARTNLVPLIYDLRHSIYANNGLDFDSLLHLEDLGLITSLSLNSYVETGVSKSGFVIYFDKQLFLELPTIDEQTLPLDVGKVLFTQAGGQLESLVDAPPVEGFSAYLQERWGQLGYIKDWEER